MTDARLVEADELTAIIKDDMEKARELKAQIAQLLTELNQTNTRIERNLSSAKRLMLAVKVDLNRKLRNG